MSWKTAMLQRRARHIYDDNEKHGLEVKDKHCLSYQFLNIFNNLTPVQDSFSKPQHQNSRQQFSQSL